MVEVIVLGAGMAGVSTALHLRNRGADVMLIDNGAARDAASFGNAGVLQSEAVEPYHMPRDLTTLLQMALGRDNGLDYDLAGLWANGRALLDYWRHSAPARHAVLSRTYADLIGQALEDHAALIAQANADHLIRRTGYLAVYRDAAQLAGAVKSADRLARIYGVPSTPLSAAEVTALEPGLDPGEGGAIHWTGPWTVSDPGALVAAYADAFIAAGGARAVADAATLSPGPHGSWQVQGADGPITARHAVLATGAATPDLARPFGHSFRLIRKRGYHRHFDAADMLSRPVVDEQHGVVLSPMRGGLRIATGAALVDAPSPAPRQMKQAVAVAESLLKRQMTPVSDLWTGVRPCTPDMLPVVGQSPRHPGLWFHFGHGHQGLTLGPTTARLLADQIMGRNSRSDVETAIAPDRISG